MTKPGNWIDVDVILNSHELEGRIGVYEIRAVKRGNRTPLKIGRLLKIDMDGVVYIGCSASPRESLAKRIKKNTERLGAYKSVKKRMPKHTLQVRYRDLSLSRSAIIKEEVKLLRQYCQKFGELPPFNSRQSEKRVAKITVK